MKKVIYLEDAINEIARWIGYLDKDMISRIQIGLERLPSAHPEIIRCEECMHNGSFDTDCPIDWAGKEYCSFAEILQFCREENR